MAVLITYRYTPLGSRLLDVYPRVAAAATIHKRFAPKTTAWVVSYGGSATFQAMFAAEFDTMESCLLAGQQFEQAPDLQELVRADMADAVLASTVQRSGGLVLSSLRPSTDP
jgi:hypothetical protein